MEDHVPTVAQNVKHDFILTSQLLQQRCESKRTIRKQELALGPVFCKTCNDCVFSHLNYIAQSNSSG